MKNIVTLAITVKFLHVNMGEKRKKFQQVKIKNTPLNWGMPKAPPVNPRDYISLTSKISPREGH